MLISSSGGVGTGEMHPCHLSFPRWIVFALGSWVLAATLSAQTETIKLNQGWNAVWLGVEPENNHPDQVFKGLPIDKVARFLQPVTSTQFISDPADAPWNEAGWGTWFAPSSEEAFLTNLHRIHGNTAYLIHATEAVNWQVTGTRKAKPYRWKLNTYNFIGFEVDPQNPPTYGDYFAGAEGKLGKQIYRLVAGRWAMIANPATQHIQPGEAVWVLCEGNTQYQGPLEVRYHGIGGIDFGKQGETRKLSFINHANSDATVTVEPVQSTLPLRYRQLDRTTSLATYEPLTTRILPSIPAGKARDIVIAPARQEMTAAGEAYLKVTSSGFIQFVPVKASL